MPPQEKGMDLLSQGQLEVVIRQEFGKQPAPQLRAIAQHGEDKGIEDVLPQRGVLDALLVAGSLFMHQCGRVAVKEATPCAHHLGA